MSDRKITIMIDPMGNPKIEAHNFHGNGCEAATKGIEDALSGGSGIDRVMKPEWFEHSTADEGQQEQQW